MDDDWYYFLLSSFMGIGPVRFVLLIVKFKTVKAICTASLAELSEVLTTKIAAEFYGYIRKQQTYDEFCAMNASHISLMYAGKPNYPELLTHISDPPICLYVKGEYETFPWNEMSSIGIVGTRTPTTYGLRIAHELSQALCCNNTIITSGLARGIDTAAHESALECKGRTVAVLGCGVDIIYPRSNVQLYHRILQTGNIIISEFPPGRTVLKGYFVSRNRIISGLSRAVVVVEGAKQSGALITARYAAEQGREVYAVPGPVGSEVSEGPHILIKEGAKLCTDPKDILGDLQSTGDIMRHEQPQLEYDEMNVFNTLKHEPCDLNTLSYKTQMTIAALLPLISKMELEGYVIKTPDGRYDVTR